MEKMKKYPVYPKLTQLPSILLRGARYQNVVQGCKLRYHPSWGILRVRCMIHLAHSSPTALNLNPTWKPKSIFPSIHNPVLQSFLHNYQNSTRTTVRRQRVTRWTRLGIAH